MITWGVNHVQFITNFRFCRNWRSWRYFKDYFPIELVKTAELPPERKYLMCSHPHGVMCAGLQCAIGSNACGWSKKFTGEPRYWS